jgi:hypothetical protein
VILLYYIFKCWLEYPIALKPQHDDIRLPFQGFGFASVVTSRPGDPKSILPVFQQSDPQQPEQQKLGTIEGESTRQTTRRGGNRLKQHAD